MIFELDFYEMLRKNSICEDQEEMCIQHELRKQGGFDSLLQAMEHESLLQNKLDIL